MTEAEDVWDLSQLVEFDDPGYVEERLSAAVAAAEELRKKHRGSVVGYGPAEVLSLLEEADEFSLEYEGPFMYSNLAYSADMTDEVAKRLNDRRRNASMLVGQALAFMELELGQLISKRPDIVNDSFLSEYKHKLERIQRQVPHMLSEAEEKLAILKDKNGINAWSQLQSDWLATRTFEIEIDGEKKRMPYGEIIGLYEHPDREIRKLAHQVVFSGLGEDKLLWATAVRSISEDHLKMSKTRNWPTPMTQSLISNDVDAETITALLTTVENNVETFRKYLRLKAKALGLEKLGNWDEVAPLPFSPDRKYSWSDSRSIIVQAYTDFDEESGKWMDEMYERRHIDGEVRPGKTSGAFCSTWHSGKSAYILQSYNGVLGDMYTQAHELGHALHAYLGTRTQKPSNYEIGSCVAETGSIFGELLLTEKLLGQANTREEKLVVLGTILDQFGQAAFQVSARVFFETSIYEQMEKGNFLDGEKLSDLWIEARNRIYGDAIDWMPEMRYWWTMKLHFYMPNYRYYNYPYVYAQLFVYAMYRLYKEQGKEFVPKLKNLLAAGSSKSPRELAAEIGFDIATVEFWQKGIDQYVEFIDKFENAL
ncbi:MAG: M3 family metallopeptidase [Candidatus Hermodarchaeota archaeon]